jgi:hypothetical protein
MVIPGDFHRAKNPGSRSVSLRKGAAEKRFFDGAISVRSGACGEVIAKLSSKKDVCSL